MNRSPTVRPPARNRPRAASLWLALAAALPLAATASAGATQAAAAAPAAATRPGRDDNAALQYWQAISLIAESTEKTLESWETAPIEGETLTMVSDTDSRLDLLHAGAAMDRCDWGLDYGKGPGLLLPHVAEARNLARLALLRARHRFGQGRADAGVDDVLAVFELARDVGSDPILISLLVQYGIEHAAIDLLARDLPKLDPAALDRLAGQPDQAPAEDRLARVWPFEAELYADWITARLGRIDVDETGAWKQEIRKFNESLTGEPDGPIAASGATPQELIKKLDAVRAHYRELEKLMSLPPDQQDARVTELKHQADRSGNVLLDLVTPNAGQALQVTRRIHARRAMLRAAVTVQRGGPERLKDAAFADPFGQRPFEYRKTEGGFELQSKLTYEGKPVVLTVGAADKQK